LDLDLGGAHVGADVAEKYALRQGLEQVAHVRTAFVGDDGAADRQEPAGTGFLHGLDDAADAVLAHRGRAGAVRAQHGQNGVRASDGRDDRGWIRDVG
jgi:hypothetical protein